MVEPTWIRRWRNCQTGGSSCSSCPEFSDKTPRNVLPDRPHAFEKSSRRWKWREATAPASKSILVLESPRPSPVVRSAIPTSSTTARNGCCTSRGDRRCMPTPRDRYKARTRSAESCPTTWVESLLVCSLLMGQLPPTCTRHRGRRRRYVEQRPRLERRQSHRFKPRSLRNRSASATTRRAPDSRSTVQVSRVPHAQRLAGLREPQQALRHQRHRSVCESEVPVHELAQPQPRARPSWSARSQPRKRCG